LAAEFGSGFSEKSLRRMIQFAEEYPEEQIVATVSRQLGWSHFIEIIPLKDSLQREFYCEMCRCERWSVRQLRKKIDGMLCAGKSDEHIELLQLEKSGIRVAAYMTELPPRKLLQKKLHEAMILAAGAPAAEKSQSPNRRMTPCLEASFRMTKTPRKFPSAALGRNRHRFWSRIHLLLTVGGLRSGAAPQHFAAHCSRAARRGAGSTGRC
jgi:hypothetical protein